MLSEFVSRYRDSLNPDANITVLRQILDSITEQLLKNYVKTQENFQSGPYCKLYEILLEKVTEDRTLERYRFHIKKAFYDNLVKLIPQKIPIFAFSWVEIISHPCFMEKLLTDGRAKSMQMFHDLLKYLLEFMEPFLRRVALTHSLRLLYKSVLRIFTILMNKFPNFLSQCYYSFCDSIPLNCIQLRNIILCAIPETVINLIKDGHQYAEVEQNALIPDVLPGFEEPLISSGLNLPLNRFLREGEPKDFLVSLGQALLSNAKTESDPNFQPKNSFIYPSNQNYNIKLFNSLIFYIGSYSVAISQDNFHNSHTLIHSYQIFHHLASSLDTEGRYILFNSIINHLRYPNKHTQWFLSLLCHLVLNISDVFIKELIARIFLERLMTSDPYPWGLRVAFKELVCKKEYQFSPDEFNISSNELLQLTMQAFGICRQYSEDR
ncbi:ccr4-not transcription complex subunit 1 [Anaeramoeba ignava]|uniref:Ccr4-not transcription complex subunit 1 n=1 Tax=Anaeramoeba ignava TaxID=1746090 RepID=A0A9Q0RCD8_ANAIG|nr:ccr4-not transcription complex subunit 1 [Anaeramoeba ignava]